MRTRGKPAALNAVEANASADKKAAKEQKAAAILAQLAKLPPDVGRNRMVGTAATAAFLGFSTPHLRRLVRAGKVPPPIKIGGRKDGWRIGVLIDVIKAREHAST